MSEKRRECFFLFGAHDQLTKRDDVRKTTDTYLRDVAVNSGLFQGRRAVADDDEKVYFWAFLFDVSFENCDAEYIALQTAFSKAKEANDKVLCNYDTIPLRPTATLSSSAIVQAAKSQNVWCNDSMITILRGVTDLDAPITLRRGEDGECSNLRTFLKDQYLPNKDNSTSDFLFKQVEAATYQRVYLTHKKMHNQAVKIFLRTFDSKSKDVFTPDSLNKVRCDPGTRHGLQSAPQTDLTKQTDSQLNDFFQTQKGHNRENIAQNMLNPPKR